MNHSLELVKADNDPTLLVNQILPAFIIIPGFIGNMLGMIIFNLGLFKASISYQWFNENWTNRFDLSFDSMRIK